jgi:tetratricopeptide (TPR) repeat protein
MIRVVVLALVMIAPWRAGFSDPAGQQAAATGAPELLFDQGKRLFDEFKYDQAIPLFDAVVTALTATTPPEKPDLLVQAYELRGRARFASADALGTERDFAALLALRPDYRLASTVSPRVVAVFDSVRKVTIGQVALSLTPPGEVIIAGRTIAATAEPQTIDLPVGEHPVTASRPGYTAVDQRVTVVAGTLTPLALALERVSSTLTIETIPADVDVVLAGQPRGRTTAGPGEASAPLVIGDLPTGRHVLMLRRDCYQPIERTITIDAPGDFRTEPIRLTRAVAHVTIRGVEASGVRLFVDGVERGPVPVDAVELCEGTHTLDVRGPSGRFVDRRDWKTGASVTLTATLRRAFPIVTARGGGAVSAEQLRTNLERALAPSTRVLLYTPADAELGTAMAGEALPADWLLVDASGALARVPKDITRDLGQRLIAKLQGQGLAAVSGGADPYLMHLVLLAPGSGEPDVLTINLADAASVRRAIAALDGELPSLVRASLETSVVDVAGVAGAVVVRPGGVGARAGLLVGDVIVSAGGAPVTSVADLQTRISAVRPPQTTLPLEVLGLNGAQRGVTASIALVPDTIPQRDGTLLYNRALIDLQDALRGTAAGPAAAAQRYNLGVIHMRLGNFDEAIAAFGQAALPEGPGVSAGTVAYLTGLCYEQTGRPLDAQTAFGKAAAAAQARLWHDGPLVAPLARQKLQRR